MRKNTTERPGAALRNSGAHDQEHRLWSRRDFLSATGFLSAGALMLGNTDLQIFQPTPLLASLANSDNDRILVMIRLDGGNDGLNTIIQRGNSHYYNNRPTIAVPDNQLWAMSPEYGMPLSTSDLQPLWAEGQMKSIFNVGYPQPNLSHFRSYDIVASGSDADVVDKTGWLGRYIDTEFAAFLEAPPVMPPALQIGVQADTLFNSPQGNLALAVSTPEEFYQIAQTGKMYSLDNLGSTPRDLERLFLRQTANAAFHYAESIQEAFGRGKNQVDYLAANPLAAPMSIVARLIKGRLGTKIFMVRIVGWDTHANQYDTHLQLLRWVANAVKSFYDDLDYNNAGLGKKVLSMTFSEFGRTIYENSAAGTDHGWGTHNLLFGGEIGNGFAGNYPDLSNPDPLIDPPFDVDFRSVYATLLQDWLGNTPDLVRYVLGGDYPILGGLVPPAAPLTGDNGRCAIIGHNPHPHLPGVIEIKFAVMRRGVVRLHILDASGQTLRTLIDKFAEKGSHIFNFKASDWNISPGYYQYRLQSGGQVFQRSFRI
jgi:uncharacterized protein (DUF1501 family)